jgi:hypothetical protein
MPIPVLTLDTQIRAALDAEGSDRYTFTEDILPSLVYSLEMTTRILDLLFADKQFSPEALVELTRTRVWQTDAYSRFTFNSADLPFNEEMWTLITVHPKAKCKPQGPLLIVGDNVSKVRLDLLYLSSEESAARRTYEQSAINRKNPFSPGNDLITNGLKSYALLDASDYTSTNYITPGTYAYEIAPGVPKELIGVRYLKRPKVPATINDSVEFRPQATGLLVDLALQWISWKMGDGTTIYQVSDRDKQQVLQTFS